ncbi:PREDICTED: putative fasciclin-like arabinogalactan protein 20 [Camelina sativa]|uniref:Fasciclin-like arabinogalactan protein 20 n=1 Tax=Camelina sativa TaxID=90675 RepID=A0ABM1QMM1_CAMSA|nr:PREDICTED: putative fasciclin-like arabinogalactan protein 20 [Camelina sativa]
MASNLLTTFFLLFFVLDLNLVAPSLTSVSSAVEVLSDSSYFSMGLTLKLASQDLNLDDWQELTIFAPSDQAFTRSGQPSLLDIKYQLSPTRLSGESLRNFPNGAKIPTLRSNSSLVVSNSSRFGGGKASINGAVVQDSPVFDDGYIVIYGSDEFFTSPTKISDDSSSSSSTPNPTSSSTGSIPIPSSATRTAPSPPNRSKPVVKCFNIFESASRLLMSRGFVIMATFLALQLETSGNNDTNMITVFAPVDEAIPNPTTKFSDYATIFRGHVINRLVSWKDLQKLAWEGSILQTVLKGYEIEVSWSGDILLLNGVPLIYPDMFVNDCIAVHGFNQMIEPKEKQVGLGESISVPNDGEEEEAVEGVHEEYSSQLGDYDGLH